jgi:hypothetical protein
MSVAASTAICKSPSAGPSGVRHPARLAVETDPEARRTGSEPGGEVAVAARLALCSELLRAGQPLRIRIRGSSMVPALWPGESVTIHSMDIKGTRVGQIVVFSRDGQLVAHRVLRIDPSEDGADDCAVVTRGDAAGEEDSPVLPAEWLGIVVSVQRFGTARTLRFAPTGSARAMAALVRGSDLLRRALDRLSMLLARSANARSPHGRPIDGFGKTPAERVIQFAAADGR